MCDSGVWRVCLCAALALLVAALYAPVRTYDFVNLDDNEYVTENTFVRSGLSVENVRWAFTAFHSGHWHPLTWLSLMLDCECFGLNAGALHLVNVLLHAGGTVLLFLWLQKASGACWRSAFAAALFALHPLRVESVAWVAARKDMLSGLFLMLTLWAYVAYARRESRWRYAWIVLWFALGLMAKPTLVIVPGALLLLDYWPLNRLRGHALSSAVTADASDQRSLLWLLAEKLPLCVLAVATLSRTLAAQQAAGAMVAGDQIPLAARLGNALWSYARYLGGTIWPFDLAVFYPLQPVGVARPLCAALGLVLVTAVVYRARGRCPYLLVGWLWFVVTLAPVSGLIQFGGQAMADRYTYIPHVGLLVAATWGLGDLLAGCSVPKALIAAGAALLLGAYAARSASQLRNWRDSVTLFEHALAVTTNNFMAHNNLGVAMQAMGRLDEAAAHYAEAVRLNPTWPEAQNNVGIAYAWRGDYLEARAHFLQALRIRPGFAGAENNLATAWAYEGNWEAAILHYSRAVELDPGYVDARYGLADALERSGRLREAAAQYARVVEARPGWQPAIDRFERVRAALRESATASHEPR